MVAYWQLCIVTYSHEMPVDVQPWQYVILAAMCNSIQADIFALNNGWRLPAMHRGLTGSHKMLADWQSWHDVILAAMCNSIQAEIFVLNNGSRLPAMHRGLTGSHKMLA